MTKPFIVFTGRDLFSAHRKSEDLVIPGETDSWDALAIVLNKILNERGTRMVWSQDFGWSASPRTDLRPEWLTEALLLGQRRIEE